MHDIKRFIFLFFYFYYYYLNFNPVFSEATNQQCIHLVYQPESTLLPTDHSDTTKIWTAPKNNNLNIVQVVLLWCSPSNYLTKYTPNMDNPKYWVKN